jgi:ParB/RepB/Spo0J family partition protein
MLTKQVKTIPIASIDIRRDSRQRRTIDVSDLVESVRRRGVLTPICVTKSGVLVFGERRLTAAIECGHTEILARIAPDNLTPHDLQLLELEENLMRQELAWQDRVRAMHKLYELSGAASERIFAESIGYDHSQVSRSLTAARELLSGNTRVAAAPSIRKAANIVNRQREREKNNLLAEIVDTIQPTAQAVPQEQVEDILSESFHVWAPAYSGPKFNLIHCDFPYGIELDDSDQLQNIKHAEDRQAQTHQTYEDSEATFWNLFDTLSLAQENVISSSAHMIFWFSMKHYERLLSLLPLRFPEWTFDEYPLIWHKTDNKGIVPDVTRRPRRVYETALFGWRGDRRIVRLAANAYGAPKESGSSHPSAKPEAMLRHFFQMLVDPNTRLLDPTCGSGSALRAADSLGAERVLGLEIDPEWAETAKARLRASRSITTLAEAVA